MDKKTIRRLLIVIFVSVLFFIPFIPFSKAVSLSPVSQTIIYESLETKEKTKEIYFDLSNPSKEKTKISLKLYGEYSKHFSIKKEFWYFNSPGESQEIRITYEDLPYLKEGIHKITIVATELPLDDKKIVASSSVIGEIVILSKIKGKFIEAKLQVMPKINTVDFNIPVKNIGTDKIERISATIEIKEGSKTIKILKTREFNLSSLDEKKLTSVWESPKKGSFRAIATIKYDENIVSMEKTFTYSEKLITINPIAVTRYGSDQFRIVLEAINPYNSISDVYADISIINKNEKLIQKLTTETISVNSRDISNIIGYLDTSYYEDGVYDMIIEVYQEDTKISALRYDDILLIDSFLLIASSPGIELFKKGVLAVLILVIFFMGYSLLKRKQYL